MAKYKLLLSQAGKEPQSIYEFIVQHGRGPESGAVERLQNQVQHLQFSLAALLERLVKYSDFTAADVEFVVQGHCLTGTQILVEDEDGSHTSLDLFKASLTKKPQSSRE